MAKANPFKKASTTKGRVKKSAGKAKINYKIDLPEADEYFRDTTPPPTNKKKKE